MDHNSTKIHGYCNQKLGSNLILTLDPFFYMKTAMMVMVLLSINIKEDFQADWK